MKIQELNPNVSIDRDGVIVDNRNNTTPEYIEAYNEDSLESVENFKLFNSKWLEELSKDFLKASSISDFMHEPETVCARDDRVKINNTTSYPYKMICKIFGKTNDGDRYMGSGFFIGPRCIITNGHVVFPDRDWAKSIEVIPAMNGNIAPFGKKTSTNFRSVVGWTRDNKMEFDYGAVILPDDELFNRVKAYFGYQIFSGNPTLNNSGYPGDKPMGTMWYNAGKVTETTERMFKYMIDTAGGQSGSPVWGNNQKVAGVHGYGGCPNKAVRVVPDVMKNWNSWKIL